MSLLRGQLFSHFCCTKIIWLSCHIAIICNYCFKLLGHGNKFSCDCNSSIKICFRVAWLPTHETKFMKIKSKHVWQWFKMAVAIDRNIIITSVALLLYEEKKERKNNLNDLFEPWLKRTKVDRVFQSLCMYVCMYVFSLFIVDKRW